MNERKEMKGEENQPMHGRREREPALSPAVDIYEQEQGVVLRADLPGVSRERLSIECDGNTLSIEGEAAIDLPEGMEALQAEMRATRYRRSFTLSPELDAETITAQMHDGVLTLHLPKRPELQPRKIEIGAG